MDTYALIAEINFFIGKGGTNHFHYFGAFYQ